MFAGGRIPRLRGEGLVGDEYDWRSLRLRAIGWTAAAVMGLSFWIVIGVAAWKMLR